MFSKNFSSTESYLDFYGLEAGGHEFVPFKSNGFELAGHTFVPKKYKATVIVLHGYLGHCGLLKNIIKELTDANFAVAVFDLPGHGMSSGEKTAIDDFSQYSQGLNDFVKTIKPLLHGPYHIIGHSTGAAIIMEYLLEMGIDDFDKVVLAAPLERSDWWTLSKIGFAIARPFCDKLPRVFRSVSSDKDFLNFIKHKDPLQAKKVSLNWVSAMFNWDKRIANVKTSERAVLVIQGTKDNIIDWKFNIKFIKSKFKNTEVEYVKNCRHELFNESACLREEIFLKIRTYFLS